jgi:V/A-type H+/Na+-transporting ATPase subunit F
MEYKIAILGSKDSVRGFQALGVDTYEVAKTQEAVDSLQKVYQSHDYAVLFITEDWADKVRKTLEELPAKALPAVVAVPSQHGSTGAGLKNLSKIVEQAVGSDVLKIGESN